MILWCYWGTPIVLEKNTLRWWTEQNMNISSFTPKACHPSIPAHPPTKNRHIIYHILMNPEPPPCQKPRNSPCLEAHCSCWSCFHGLVQVLLCTQSFGDCQGPWRCVFSDWGCQDSHDLLELVRVSFLFQVMIFWTRNQPHLKSRFHALFGTCYLKKSAINSVVHLYLYIHILCIHQNVHLCLKVDRSK